MFIAALKESKVLQWGLISIGVMLAYSNSLNIPFYFDDILSIASNPGVVNQDVAYLWEHYAKRITTYLTFYANFKIGKLDVAGYHITNIAIHITVAWTVWSLVRELMKDDTTGDDNSKIWLPLTVGLLFSMHPLQTQTVDYIVQRASLLAALFYVLTLLAYLKLRKSTGWKTKAGWVAIGIASGLLAITSKENAATLPLMVVILELIYLSKSSNQRWSVVGAAAILFILAWVAASYLAKVDILSLGLIKQLSAAARSEFQHSDYLATQMAVLWLYMKLFLWPVGLHLEYDINVLTDWLKPEVMLSVLGHFIVIGMALWVIKRNKLVGFGILFYYVTQTIESGLVPLPDLAFEHRTYLPNFGLSLVAGATYLKIANATNLSDKRLLGILLLIATTAGAVTWNRNKDWQNPLRFYTKNVEIAPNAMRARVILTSIYVSDKNYHKALGEIEKIEKNLPPSMMAALLTNKVIALTGVGETNEAMELAESLLNSNYLEDPRLKAKIYDTKAVIYFGWAEYSKAEMSLLNAVKYDPMNINILQNMAKFYAMTGNTQRVKDVCIAILNLEPNNQFAKAVLSKIGGN